MSLIEQVRARRESLERRRIEIPEWGVTVYAKPYTLADRRRLKSAMARSDEEGFAALVIAKCENEDGTPAFDRPDVTELVNIGEADVLERVVGQICASYPATIEDAEKNSPRTAS